MRGHNTTTRSIALALAVLLTVCNLPLAAATLGLGWGANYIRRLQ